MDVYKSQCREPLLCREYYFLATANSWYFKLSSKKKGHTKKEQYLHLQARSKHKMTGEAERVAHINSPPPPFASVPRLKHTSWYMLDHYICLQYLLFLSLIFRLCWLWRNRELVWDIVRGKFAKQLLSVFFLPNEVISHVYKGQSICSVLQEHATSWGSSVLTCLDFFFGGSCEDIVRLSI